MVSENTSLSGCSYNIKKELGLVHVYTGNGKGKTTAALGLAFRASGKGLKVIMIQFLKPANGYGEHISANLIPNFTILPMGADHMCGHAVSREIDLKLTYSGLSKAEEVLKSGKYDMVILDEINNSMKLDLLSPDDLIDILEKRAPNTEVVLTGRDVPDKIIKYADLVTEMLLIKHPFDRGISAREGIEY